ncbi:MAG TPA: PRC-barrel domain-containing protein [Methylomirabilota bacterium]|nr:PRC-barrel domain-containing protein [Methylomirabilota bacterium]
MLRHLLLTTAAVVSLASGAVLAQNSTTTQPPATPPAPAADQPAQPAAPMQAPSTSAPSTSSDTSSQAQPAAPAEQSKQAATPPPSDAIIPQQAANDMRADKLIGMRVYNMNGDEVGKVDDILIGKDGKISGVVLSVGGVFGIGSKAVGLVWKEVDISPQQDTMQISYSKEQLEVAPEFKRLEPTPAPSGSTSQTQ